MPFLVTWLPAERGVNCLFQLRKAALGSKRAVRRLAAILVADVAGYSRMMGADEEGTLARLKTLRRALVDPTLIEHRGRLVKTTGDGALMEFPSVVDALRFAIEVQRGWQRETPTCRRSSESSSASA